MQGEPVPIQQPDDATPVAVGRVDFNYRAIMDALGGPEEVVRLLTQRTGRTYRLKSVRAWYYRDSIPSDDLAVITAIMVQSGKGSIHDYLTNPT